MMKKVIVIVGPTASGKTKASIELAKKLNAEIINGDSVQVYKELNIGSAKIKDDEKENIPHHLFDVVSIDKDYTVFEFQRDARKLIDEINIPIIVGGTGLYIKSALYDYEFNVDESYSPNIYDHLSNDEIYQILMEKDPTLKIDKNNRVRLTRALYLSKTNHKRSEKTGKDNPIYNILTIYLDLDREILRSRLIKRLDIMLEEGFIDEVKELKNINKRLNIIGYRELYDYLDNKLSLDQAKEEIIKVSMRLAKKQKTWFLNQMNSVIVNALDSNIHDKIYEIAKEFLYEG